VYVSRKDGVGHEMGRRGVLWHFWRLSSIYGYFNTGGVLCFSADSNLVHTREHFIKSCIIAFYLSS
jgi:hypothetical protein